MVKSNYRCKDLEIQNNNLNVQIQKEKEISRTHIRDQQLSVIEESRRNTSQVKIDSFSHEGFDMKTSDSRPSSKKSKIYEKNSLNNIIELNKVGSLEKGLPKAIPKPKSSKKLIKVF